MIKLVYSKTNYVGGVKAYYTNLYHDLSEEMQYLTDVKLVSLPKIELKFRGKRYGGWKSQDILSFMVGNAYIVHAMSDSEITKHTNVVTIHDLYSLTMDIFKDASKHKNHSVERLKIIRDRNIKVVVQTNIIANDVRKFIPDADITVIPSKIFIGTPTFNPYPSDGKLHLVTIGKISHNNTHERKLINELYEWIKDIPDVELYHIGPVENPKYINYAKNIHQLGSVDQQTKYNYLAYADKFVFKTLGEGQGYPTMEAMRLGTQPLINDLPEHRELLGNYPLYYHNKEEFIEKMWYPSRSGVVEHVRQYDNWIEKYRKVYGI